MSVLGCTHDILDSNNKEPPQQGFSNAKYAHKYLQRKERPSACCPCFMTRNLILISNLYFSKMFSKVERNSSGSLGTKGATTTRSNRKRTAQLGSAAPQGSTAPQSTARHSRTPRHATSHNMAAPLHHRATKKTAQHGQHRQKTAEHNSTAPRNSTAPQNTTQRSRAPQQTTPTTRKQARHGHRHQNTLPEDNRGQPDPAPQVRTPNETAQHTATPHSTRRHEQRRPHN